MSIREKGRKRLNNIGFTLVEMMVVLTMMTIVLGVSAWGVTGWIQHSEFLKNEANAQTIYLAAQSALSNADSKGTSDSIISRIYNEANAKGNFIDASETSKKTEYGIPTLADNEGNMHRYAALTVTKGQYSSGDDSVLFDIISPYIFDTEALNGTITVEFDLYSKSVYSVFYSAWSTEMAYGPGTNVARGKFYINAVNRTEAVRSDLAMGYYAVDQVNVALLDAETLRLSNVTLNNEETLNLRFGSNSKLGDLDTIYDISFYEQKPGESVQADYDDHFLFSVSIDNNNIVGGEDINTGDPKNRIKSKRTLLDVKDAHGNVTLNNVPFILVYNGSNYELILDAMNTSQTLAACTHGPSDINTYSITRLLGLDPKYIFAEVSVKPTEAALAVREYNLGSPVLSNTENDMYAFDAEEITSGDSTSYKVNADTGEYKIAEFRHLSNMRYSHTTLAKPANQYTLTKDIDWNNNIVYDGVAKRNKPESSETAAFPTVPEIESVDVLDGAGYSLDNVKLNETSNVKYESGNVNANVAGVLGLFGTNEGHIQSLGVSSAKLEFGSSDATASNTSIFSSNMKSIGVLTGINSGTINGIYFDENCDVYAKIKYNASGFKADEADGVGMMCGTMEVVNNNQVDRVLTDGKVRAEITNTDGQEFTYNNIEECTDNGAGVGMSGGYRYAGVGGVCGYIYTSGSNSSTFGVDKTAVSPIIPGMNKYLSSLDDKSVKNQAEVSGNMFIGGVVGNLYSEEPYSDTRTDLTMQNCHNDAKISLDTDFTDEQLDKIEAEAPTFAKVSGMYAGGVIGYNYQARIADCTYDMSNKEYIASYEAEASGESTAALKEDSKGIFVGGIAGFSYDGVVDSCSSNNGGYLLGYDYVGGIVGSTKASDGGATGGGPSTNSVLISNDNNGCYVIGHSFVGGIIGMNTKGVTVKDTSNDGIAAGDGIDIGGIAGRNSGDSSKKAMIVNCSAQLNDYGSNLFDMVKDKWGFFGSNVGGQVGFNEYGVIEFNNDTGNSVKSVSSIAVGTNNVGGFVGYNGINGTIKLNGSTDDYISGRVYGKGDCVGGFIGINLAPEAISEQKIIISTISVTGQRMVGGVVGANVLDMDTVAGSGSTFNITYNNKVSKIKGVSMVGGLIGYNMLTTDSNLLPASNIVESGSTFVGVDSSNWCNNFAVADTYGIYGSSGKLNKENTKTFTIGNSSAATVDYNNAEIYAEHFGGGLVGANEENSKLILVHARNKGQIKEEGKYDKVKLSDMLGFSDGYAGINSGIFGGIIGYATENTVVDSCDNQGSMQLYKGAFGGIVGLNEGYIVDCFTSTNIGEATLNVIGGIAGINHTVSDAKHTVGTYVDINNGEIKSCYNDKDITVNGKTNVGGVCGINAGILSDCYALGTVRGKVNVGGVTGVNLATIYTAGALKQAETLDVVGNTNVGGIVGVNDKTSTYEGKIEYTESNVSQGDKGINVTARADRAGGIVGFLKSGHIKGDNANSANSKYIENQAKVKADNYAGGVVGFMPEGIAGVAITYAKNTGDVIAGSKYAGGVVSVNDNNKITYSDNCGNVSASLGYAGGIASTNENNGLINFCKVYATDDSGVKITSTVEHGGAIVAVNDKSSSVLDCTVSTNVAGHKVILAGSKLKNIGYMVGLNEGMIARGQVLENVEYQTSAKEITLGGIAGYNKPEATVKDIGKDTATAHKVALTNSGNIKYLGGVVGNNEGLVKDCVFSGKISESSMATAGHSYGGIVGINHLGAGVDKSDKDSLAVVSGDSIKGAEIDVIGMSAIDSGQTSEGKLKHTSFVGGIAGYNDEDVTISKCYIDSGDQTNIKATYGMVGGITGANSGKLEYCGYAKEMGIVDDVYDNLSVKKYGKPDGSDAGINRLNKLLSKSQDNKYESITATDEMAESDMEAIITMKTGGDGYLGGISGFNSTTGIVTKCASGKWKVVSNETTKAAQIAGVVAQNESEKEFSYDVNCAFVMRNVKWINSESQTLYHVGGVIGSMQNRTASGWIIEGCVNLGSVVDHNSHNCAGVIANWIYNGGTVQYSFNYGTLKTDFQHGEQGTAAGIVGLINGLTTGQTVNVITCQNHGIINAPFDTSDKRKIANDVGGIVSEINAPKSTSEELFVNVVDCVNGADAEVYAYAKAIGILSWVGGDTGKTTVDNVHTNIIRCRNYSDKVLCYNNGKSSSLTFDRCGGIFGSHGTSTKSTVVIKNCISVNNQTTTSDNVRGQITWSNSTYQDAQNQSHKDWAYNYIIDQYSFKYINNNTAELNNNSNSVNSTVDVRAIGKGIHYINERNTKVLKTYPDGDIANGGSVRRLYIVKNLSSTNTNGEYVAVLDKHDKIKDKKFVVTGLSMLDVNGNNSYLDEDGGKNGYGVVKRKDKTTNDFDDTAQVLLKFKEQSGKSLDGSKPDYLDITDEVIQAYYDDYLEHDDFEKPTITTLTQKEGSYYAAWTDPNIATEHYELESTVYGVNKGTAVTESNVSSLNPISTKIHKYYQTDGSFEFPSDITIKSDKDYYVAVRVKAVGTKKESDYSDYKVIKHVAILPKPDVSIVRVEDAWYYRLINFKDYDNFEGWKVDIKLIDGKSAKTITSSDIDHTTGISKTAVTFDADKSTTLRAIASIGGSGESKLFTSNAVVSISTYIKNENVNVSNEVFRSVDNTDFEYSATLKMSGGGNDWPRQTFSVEIYAENQTTHMTESIAVKDVAVGRDNSVDVKLTKDDIVQGVDITKYDNFRAYFWYTSTGLGPVYTYYEITDPTVISSIEAEQSGYQRKDGYIKRLRDDGTAEYLRSFVIKRYYGMQNAHAHHYHEPRFNNKERVITYLPEITIDSNYVTTFDKDKNTLSYTYTWTGDYPEGYTVKMYGTKSSGAEEEIEITGYDGKSKSLTVNADEWDYSSVRLEVTGKNTKEDKLARSAEQTFDDIPRRLAKLDSPFVSINEQDGLNYTVRFSESEDEDCVGYQVYIQDITADGENGPITKLGDKIDGRENTSVKVNLENYAKHKVKIMVVALAPPNQNPIKIYDSVYGTPLTVEIFGRIDKPDATFDWTDVWKSAYVKESDFISDKNGLSATVSNPKSTNTYLMFGLVYKTKEEADVALAKIQSAANDDEIMNKVDTVFKEAKANKDCYTFGFGANKSIATSKGSGKYVIASNDFESDKDWTISYAGYYMIPLIRATNNTGVSSVYACGSSVLSIPKVQLDSPSVKKSKSATNVDGGAYQLAYYAVDPDTNINVKVNYDTYTWTRSDSIPDYHQINFKANVDHIAKAGEPKSEGTVATDKINYGVRVETDESKLTAYVANDKDDKVDSIDKSSINDSIDDFVKASSTDVDQVEETEGDVTTTTYTYTDTNKKDKLVVIEDTENKTTTYLLNDQVIKVEAELDEDKGSVTLKGITNIVSGRVTTATGDMFYKFESDPVIKYEKGSKSAKYTFVVPQPQGTFTFDYTNNGVTDTCSTSTSSKFFTECEIKTCMDTDTRIKSSEVTEVNVK